MVINIVAGFTIKAVAGPLISQIVSAFRRNPDLPNNRGQGLAFYVKLLFWFYIVNDLRSFSNLRICYHKETLGITELTFPALI